MRIQMLRPVLCALAVLGVAAVARAAPSISVVGVMLEGPDEGWVDNNLTYYASPMHMIDEDTLREIMANQATIRCEFTWSVAPAAVVAGGGTGDGFATICYAWADGGAVQTVSVTVKVIVTLPGGGSISDQATASKQVTVKRPELTSFEAIKDSICAGAKANSAHQTALVAHVTDGFGNPAPGKTVSFQIVTEDHVAAAAQVAPATAVTNGAGDAAATLTSSDKVCTVGLKASGDWGQELTESVGVALPAATPDPEDPVALPVGGQRTLKETLMCAEAAVPAHDLDWEITEVYGEDDEAVGSPSSSDYGEVSPTVNPTDWSGEGTATYSSGSKAGTIVITAADDSCYDSDGEHPIYDTFTVSVVRLDHLEVSGAYQVGETDTWAAGISDSEAYVTVTANLKPSVSAEEASQVLSWSGGEAVPDDPFSRRVSRQATGTTTVTAYCGMAGQSVTVVVCEITSVSAMSGAVTIDDDNAATAADPDDTAGVIVVAGLSPAVSPVPDQLLVWSGGAAVPDHPERRKLTKTAPAKTVVSCSCGDSSDSLTLWVIGVELEIGSGEVYVNSDDDNEDTTQDRNQNPVPGENDLGSVVLKVLPEDVPGGTVALSCTSGIALWAEEEKNSATGTPWDLESDTLPTTACVEGKTVSTNPGDQEITLNYSWSSISVEATAEVTVLPREGESEAWLEICDGLVNGEYTKASGAIGGVVFPVLYVKVGAGERMKSDQSSMTIRVTDLYGNYDAGTDVDFDVTVDMTSGWNVKGANGWSDPTAGPAATDNKDGSAPLLFRKKITDWNTCVQPLGCNGAHSVKATEQAVFQEWEVGQGWVNDYESGPTEELADVRNLFIADVKVTEGTIDYFKWDPDADAPLSSPTITFALKDADPQDTYECIVCYRSTSGSRTWDGNPYWAATKTQTADPGGSTPVTINLADPNTSGGLDANTHDWGTYTFDIVAVEKKGDAQVDRNGLKEPYCLWVPAQTPEDPAREGHQATFAAIEDHDPQLRVAYWLNDQCNRDAEELNIVVVDPLLSERACVGVPKQVGEVHEGVDEDQDGQPDWIPGSVKDWIPVYTVSPDDPGGNWPTLWTGADKCGVHSPYRRTHDHQRMMVANAGPRRKRALHIATDCTIEGMEGFHGQIATSSASEQSKWPRAAGYQIQCSPNGKGAGHAHRALVRERYEIFLSAGHASGPPYGQAFCVNDAQSWLKPTPTASEPGESNSTSGGILYFYLQDRGEAWKSLSNCELAFFNACCTASAGAIAPAAAGSCNAQAAVGFHAENLHGTLYDDFLAAFWHKWGVNRSVEEALAWAEHEAGKEYNRLRKRKPTQSDCGVFNARLFLKGSATPINPDPNDWRW